MVRRILPLVAGLLWAGSALAADVSLLNVSYDPTRELYAEFNKAFAAAYQKETGKSVEIKQSHGGSGKQARAVIDGLQADVVTLALAYDIDAIAAKGLIPPTGRSGCRTTPRPTPRPSSSWCARAIPRASRIGTIWSSPASASSRRIRRPRAARAGTIWPPGAMPQKKFGGDDKAQEFVGDLFKNVPVLDTGARGSTVTFVERGVGDVLLAWENEAFLAQREFGKDKFEIVVAAAVDPGRAAGHHRRQDRRQAGHPRRGGGVSQVLVYHRRPGNRRKQLLPSARSEIAGIRKSFPRSSWSRSTTSSAAGPRRRRNTSPTAASSTRSTRTDLAGRGQGAL